MSIIPILPVILQDGTLADATQVMADFYAIQNNVNANAAANGVNSDITSLIGLTTPLPISEGGTGASTVAQALINLGITAALAALIVPPVGSVILWTSATAPTNFFECNGQAISRTTYANLFSVTGTSFGVGDGSTTFNLPDLRGYFARGWDHGAGVDPGRVFGSTQQDQFQTHTHGTNETAHHHTGTALLPSGGTGQFSTGGAGGAGTFTTSSVTTGLTVTAPNTGTTGSETRPKNVALMYCIRYQ